MNAVSRFDATRAKRRGLPKFVPPILYALGGVLAVALIFQLFFRYQYIENQGTLWRVDRLTQQMCQVSIGQAKCESMSAAAREPASKNFSTSTSTSTSLSTSIVVKPVRPHPKH